MAIKLKKSKRQRGKYIEDATQQPTCLAFRLPTYLINILNGS